MTDIVQRTSRPTTGHTTAVSGHFNLLRNSDNSWTLRGTFLKYFITEKWSWSYNYLTIYMYISISLIQL